MQALLLGLLFLPSADSQGPDCSDTTCEGIQGCLVHAGPGTIHIDAPKFPEIQSPLADTNLTYYQACATNPPDIIEIFREDLSWYQSHEITPHTSIIIPNGYAHRVLSTDPNSKRFLTTVESLPTVSAASSNNKEQEHAQACEGVWHDDAGLFDFSEFDPPDRQVMKYGALMCIPHITIDPEAYENRLPTSLKIFTDTSNYFDMNQLQSNFFDFNDMSVFCGDLLSQTRGKRDTERVLPECNILGRHFKNIETLEIDLVAAGYEAMVIQLRNDVIRQVIDSEMLMTRETKICDTMENGTVSYDVCLSLSQDVDRKTFNPTLYSLFGPEHTELRRIVVAKEVFNPNQRRLAGRLNDELKKLPQVIKDNLCIDTSAHINWNVFELEFPECAQEREVLAELRFGRVFSPALHPLIKTTRKVHPLVEVWADHPETTFNVPEGLTEDWKTTWSLEGEVYFDRDRSRALQLYVSPEDDDGDFPILTKEDANMEVFSNLAGGGDIFITTWATFRKDSDIFYFKDLDGNEDPVLEINMNDNTYTIWFDENMDMKNQDGVWALTEEGDPNAIFLYGQPANECNECELCPITELMCEKNGELPDCGLPCCDGSALSSGKCVPIRDHCSAIIISDGIVYEYETCRELQDGYHKHVTGAGTFYMPGFFHGGTRFTRDNVPADWETWGSFTPLFDDREVFIQHFDPTMGIYGPSLGRVPYLLSKKDNNVVLFGNEADQITQWFLIELGPRMLQMVYKDLNGVFPHVLLLEHPYIEFDGPNPETSNEPHEVYKLYRDSYHFVHQSHMNDGQYTPNYPGK